MWELVCCDIHRDGGSHSAVLRAGDDTIALWLRAGWPPVEPYLGLYVSNGEDASRQERLVAPHEEAVWTRVVESDVDVSLASDYSRERLAALVAILRARAVHVDETTRTQQPVRPDGPPGEPEPRPGPPARVLRVAPTALGRLRDRVLWFGTAILPGVAVLQSLDTSRALAFLLRGAAPILLVVWAVAFVKAGPDTMVPLGIRYPDEPVSDASRILTAIMVGVYYNLIAAYPLSLVIFRNHLGDPSFSIHEQGDPLFH